MFIRYGNKRYSKFIECNTSDYDENTHSLISDRNLADIMIDNETANVFQEVKNICEQNQVLQEQLDKDDKRNQEESKKDTHTMIDIKLQV